MPSTNTTLMVETARQTLSITFKAAIELIDNEDLLVALRLRGRWIAFKGVFMPEGIEADDSLEHARLKQRLDPHLTSRASAATAVAMASHALSSPTTVIWKGQCAVLLGIRRIAG